MESPSFAECVKSDNTTQRNSSHLSKHQILREVRGGAVFAVGKNIELGGGKNLRMAASFSPPFGSL